MLRRPAFRIVQNYARNGRGIIGFSGLMPSEHPFSPLSKSHEIIGCTRFEEIYLGHYKIARLSGYFEALRSLKHYSEMEHEMKLRNLVEESGDMDMSNNVLPEVLSFPDENVDMSNNVLPEVLPFPDENGNMSNNVLPEVLPFLDENGDMSKSVLPEVLPFPDETCSLKDLTCLYAHQNMPDGESFDSMGPNDNADLILWILRELIFKLWGSHSSGVILGNLTPHNVSIVKGDCMLPSTVCDDDSLCLEWKAPEQILCKTTTKESDMFTFGCILYFCITKGFHPFGDTPEQCVHNIVANKMNISRVKDLPDAYHLISLLLNPKPESRTRASNVFFHPFFKDLEQKVRLLYMLYNASINGKVKLESNLPVFRNRNWHERFYAYIIKHRFSTDSEQPIEEFKDVFGPRGSPTFFPLIFMGLYELASELISDDLIYIDQFSDELYLTLKSCGFKFPHFMPMAAI